MDNEARQQGSMEEFIPTRKSLLSRLKDWRDHESWKVFFDTYWKLIYTAAIRAGLTDAEAQDVVQETVIGIARKIPEFSYNPAKGSFKGWLMRQTAWRITSQFRKRMPIRRSKPDTTDSTVAGTIDQVPDPGSPLEDMWNAEWERTLLDAAMRKVKASVDPKQYQMYDLYVLKNWPASRVSRDLRVRTASVYLVKHRVGRLVRNELRKLNERPF